MASFNELLFEKKLLALKDTQDSISGLSSWCLQQPQHHKKIVQIWLQVLKKVKIEQRLSLFYLANDVIQYSKRKGFDFVESWGTALQRATTMVRGDDKVRTKVLRLFTIWNERNIYDESFLVDLVGLLSSRTPAQASVPDAQDFQPSTLITKIRSCKVLEDDTDLRLKIVNDNELCLSDADALRCSLKDRRHGEDVVAEVEEGIGKMEAYIRALEVEVKERQELIDLLDLADVFYETQKGEARIVCNAYRNFGMRVKSLKRKLDELMPSLASPVPSPDINAPSPSPESDIDLPDDVKQGLGNLGMSSFIGTIVVPENQTVLTPMSPQPVQPVSYNQSPQPVQPIQHHHSSHHQPVQQSLRQSSNVVSLHNNSSHNLEEVPINLPNLHEPPPPPPPHPIPPPQQIASQSFVSPTSLSYNQSVIPPLLGDGQDFPINGGDSFLSQNSDNRSSPIPPLLGTSLSFIGNADFQFDFQKEDIFGDNVKIDLDTPASPSPERMPAEDSLSDELISKNVSKEGKPIEVISSTKSDTGFTLADFLKNLVVPRGSSQNRLSTSETIESPDEMDAPLVDTSVPPPILEEPFPEKLWNSTLPQKFPSWGDSQTSWGEGINSPPGYEEGFGNSLDCEIPVPEVSSEDIEDVLRPPIDIDHRNLISLTGSPLNNDNTQWQQSALDSDYRKIPVQDNRDIVESVDMEMSDDEEAIPGSFSSMKLKTASSGLLTSLQKNQINRKMHRPEVRGQLETLTGGPNQSISFNIPITNKILAESPLKEKEEPKKKLSLHKLNPSPPRNIIEISKMMPPPMPPMSLSQDVSTVEEKDISSPVAIKGPPSDDILSRCSPKLETEKFNPKQEENKMSQNNSLGSQFLNKNIDSKFSGPNTGPRFPNSVSGPGFNNGNEQKNNNSSNNIACQISDVNSTVNNEKNEEQENDDSKDNVNWMPPLNTPPPFMSQGPPMFRPRPPGGPTIWRGPRRGMPHRFRPPGGNGPPHQPGNFQPPHMGPRPSFRGNNKWRPRFSNW